MRIIRPPGSRHPSALRGPHPADGSQPGLAGLDLYGELGDIRGRSRGRRARPGRRLAVAALPLVAFLLFAAGVAADSLLLHLGAQPRSASMVIGVIHDKSSSSTVAPSPAVAQPSALSWGRAVPVDPTVRLTSLSCPVEGFCAAVDAEGRAVLDLGGSWTAPYPVDPGHQINSVSCANSTFCLAVDQQGDVNRYDGSSWSVPQLVDHTPFPELTSVSCATPSFCAAVDGDGNGLIFDGQHWSAPHQVDPSGWSVTSHDAASLSCPDVGFCVGADTSNEVFFYASGSWQQATSVASSTPSTGSGLRYSNAVTCASSGFCVASQNLGEVVAYNGQQWSLPVEADPSSFLVSLSCPTTTFCAALDSLLPQGFNNESSDANGRVVLFNGTTWSPPQEADSAGIATAISCPSPTSCIMTDASGNAVLGAPHPAGVSAGR
ncbi:MAG: hypothetical protein KGQ66_00125 [Acidobacteriota bacterium]|nr:hypothetical protein [Acidobacteriota bacterium]